MTPSISRHSYRGSIATIASNTSRSVRPVAGISAERGGLPGPRNSMPIGTMVAFARSRTATEGPLTTSGRSLAPVRTMRSRTAADPPAEKSGASAYRDTSTVCCGDCPGTPQPDPLAAREQRHAEWKERVGGRGLEGPRQLAMRAHGGVEHVQHRAGVDPQSEPLRVAQLHFLVLRRVEERRDQTQGIPGAESRAVESPARSRSADGRHAPTPHSSGAP